MQLCYKIWLDNNGKAFGTGPYELLVNVERYGSLSEAANNLNMSYSKAWKMVNMVEKKLGFMLLNRRTGGFNGGGSSLTEEAKIFLHKYAAFEKEADELLNRLFQKHFG